MKKRTIAGIFSSFLAVAVILTMSACSMGEVKHSAQQETERMQDKEMKEEKFTSISMEEAGEIFREEGDYLILDVRRPDEYAEGHIPGAVNLPNEDIGDLRPEVLKDLEQTIYVYCRSGRRSREAAGKLVSLGYERIIECGGILDWKGEIQR